MYNNIIFKTFFIMPTLSISPLFSKESERKLVSKIARGNINLQLGRYQTSQDITDKIKKLASYKFTP